jgi:hypothetical protein
MPADVLAAGVKTVLFAVVPCSWARMHWNQEQSVQLSRAAAAVVTPATL